MSPRFGSHSHDSPPGRWRRPPNYSSRAVQVRLLMLVTLAMLVLLAMFKVADPKFWESFGFRNDGDGRKARPVSREPVDTRLRRKPTEASPTGDNKQKSPNESDAARGGKSETGPPSDENPVDRAWHDGWSKLLGQLDHAKADSLRRMLQAARAKQPLEAKHHDEDAKLLGQVELFWTEYLDKARQSLAKLDPEQQTAWQSVLEQLKSDRIEPTQRALNTLLDAGRLTDQQRENLRELSRLVDRWDLGRVEDNTVHRGAEKFAWFRLLEKLRDADPATLQGSQGTYTGFSELYRQPDQYRGQLVTVRGQIQLGYHLLAPRNIYGIEGYNVFWLKPAGGPTSPIVIYCLETPPGFPTVTNQRQEAKAFPGEAEFTGYFYKNWAYLAQDGTRVAPLILAKMPAWEPAEDNLLLQTQLPSVTWIVMAVLATGAVAVGLAILASRRGSVNRDVEPKQTNE